MRATRPSLTARHVALERVRFSRPEVPTGDADAERRLYRSLGRRSLPRGAGEVRRMERRTAFFDAETLGTLRRGTTQVVVVGAGYDGRALRFATPGVRWFEVDHPATQEDKRRRLAAAGIEAANVTFVPLDLVGGDLRGALGDAGHDPARPSLFVVEGLLGYLARLVSAALLSGLRAIAAPGSRLAVAFPIVPKDPSSSELLLLRLRGLLVSAVGEPWLVRFGPDEPEEVLRGAGWEIGPSLRAGGGAEGLARYEGRHGVLVGAEPAAVNPADAARSPREAT